MARHVEKQGEDILVISAGVLEGMELASAVIEYNAMNDYSIFLQQMPRPYVLYGSQGFKGDAEGFFMMSKDRGSAVVRMSANGRDEAFLNEVISDMFIKSPIKEDESFTSEKLKKAYDEVTAQFRGRCAATVAEVTRNYGIVQDIARQEAEDMKRRREKK